VRRQAMPVRRADRASLLRMARPASALLLDPSHATRARRGAATPGRRWRRTAGSWMSSTRSR
jgi:hypothetical protein